VKTFIPVLSERTLLVPSLHKVQRWRKIAQEASEQSERQIVPKILDPVDLTTALARLNPKQVSAYLSVTRLECPHLAQSLLEFPTLDPLIIAIGPEGGWTEKEIEQFISIGFKTVSLGGRILRTITAPLVAVSIVLAWLKE
jgi:16S rRNA (uracil1498-N3)-methyltransferase